MPQASLLDLPDEIVQNIAAFAPVPTAKALACVNKNLHSIITPEIKNYAQRAKNFLVRHPECAEDFINSWGVIYLFPLVEIDRSSVIEIFRKEKLQELTDLFSFKRGFFTGWIRHLKEKGTKIEAETETLERVGKIIEEDKNLLDKLTANVEVFFNQEELVKLVVTLITIGEIDNLKKLLSEKKNALKESLHALREPETDRREKIIKKISAIESSLNKIKETYFYRELKFDVQLCCDLQKFYNFKLDRDSLEKEFKQYKNRIFFGSIGSLNEAVRSDIDKDIGEKNIDSDETRLNKRKESSVCAANVFCSYRDRINVINDRVVRRNLPNLVMKAVSALTEEQSGYFRRWLECREKQYDVVETSTKSSIVLSVDESLAYIEAITSFEENDREVLCQFLKEPERKLLTVIYDNNQFKFNILTVAMMYGTDACIDFIFQNDHFSRKDLIDPLLNACFFGREKFLSYAIKNFLNARNFLQNLSAYGSETLLEISVVRKKLDCLKILTADIKEISGSFLDKRNANGDNALMVAARLGDLEAVRILLRDDRAYLDTTNNQGNDAFKLAIVSGNLALVQYLKPYYKDPLSVGNIYQNTALMWAVWLRNQSAALGNFTLEDLQKLKAIPNDQWKENDALYEQIQELDTTTYNSCWKYYFNPALIELIASLLEESNCSSIAKKLITVSESQENESCIKELLTTDSKVSLVENCLPHLERAITYKKDFFIEWFFKTSLFSEQEKFFAYATLYQTRIIYEEVSNTILGYCPWFVNSTLNGQSLLTMATKKIDGKHVDLFLKHGAYLNSYSQDVESPVNEALKQEFLISSQLIKFVQNDVKGVFEHIRQALSQAEKVNNQNVFENFSKLLRAFVKKVDVEMLVTSVALCPYEAAQFLDAHGDFNNNEENNKKCADALIRIFYEIMDNQFSASKNLYRYMLKTNDEILRTQFVERIKFYASKPIDDGQLPFFLRDTYCQKILMENKGELLLALFDIAITHGRYDVVKILMDSELGKPDNFETFPPLLTALKQNKAATVALLLSRYYTLFLRTGIDLLIQENSVQQCQCLLEAVRHLKIDIVQFFIDLTPEYHCKNKTLHNYIILHQMNFHEKLRLYRYYIEKKDQSSKIQLELDFTADVNKAIATKDLTTIKLLWDARVDNIYLRKFAQEHHLVQVQRLPNIQTDSKNTQVISKTTELLNLPPVPKNLTNPSPRMKHSATSTTRSTSRMGGSLYAQAIVPAIAPAPPTSSRPPLINFSENPKYAKHFIIRSPS